jgi:hypothetical protein
MNEPRQREDRDTHEKVVEAFALKRAFGNHAAKTFLQQVGVQPSIVDQVLMGKYDRRQDPDRRLAARAV